jgi:hypothetical protein
MSYNKRMDICKTKVFVNTFHLSNISCEYKNYVKKKDLPGIYNTIPKKTVNFFDHNI